LLRRIANRGAGYANGYLFAVLAISNSFIAADAFSSPDPRQVPLQIGPGIKPQEARERLSYYFSGSVPEYPLSTLVPTHDDAGDSRTDNGIIT
jgi:hypothetical protein